MRLADLTSREAVIAALEECDALDREQFLRRYGYKHSRLYLLTYNGRTYDSKAIVGVAYGKQHGTPLRARDFSGGIATVIPTLKRLGFDAEAATHPLSRLEVGKIYQRKDLLEMFGGQLQAGIWTPKEFPVLMLFTGESGEQYGYADSWTPGGAFRYTGEGQQGDMQLTKGNKAIRDHRADGKDLLLFEDQGKGKGVRFEGVFECISYETVKGKDKDGTSRKILVFDLVPVAAAAVEQPSAIQAPAESLSALRKKAYEAAATLLAPSERETRATWYARSDRVRRYVLARANGTCEACGQSAPFKRRDGTPYLEPHHTTRLADEGLDHPASVAAICPTCHRRIHSGEDGDSWNRSLQTLIANKEQKQTTN